MTATTGAVVVALAASIEYQTKEPIHACPECPNWCVEIVQPETPGEPAYAREWHAVGCTWLAAELAARAAWDAESGGPA